MADERHRDHEVEKLIGQIARKLNFNAAQAGLLDQMVNRINRDGTCGAVLVILNEGAHRTQDEAVGPTQDLGDTFSCSHDHNDLLLMAGLLLDHASDAAREEGCIPHAAAAKALAGALIPNYHQVVSTEATDEPGPDGGGTVH